MIGFEMWMTARLSMSNREADLDVEMVTAAAPGATVEVISCSNTTTTFGVLIAIQNIISAGSPPPIISISYGECEAVFGAAANRFQLGLPVRRCGRSIGVYLGW